MKYRLLAFFVFCTIFCAGIPSVSAHAFLDTASPAVGATIQVAPSAVTLTFTEELEPHFSSIVVQDASGARVDQGDAHTDPRDAKTFAIGLKPLQPGGYKVIWRATSVDTHKTSGNYTFTLTK